jgi:hypothetical protein
MELSSLESSSRLLAFVNIQGVMRELSLKYAQKIHVNLDVKCHLSLLGFNKTLNMAYWWESEKETVH